MSRDNSVVTWGGGGGEKSKGEMVSDRGTLFCWGLKVLHLC